MAENITAQHVSRDLYATEKIVCLKLFIHGVNAITIISTWFLSILIITPTLPEIANCKYGEKK